MKVLVVDDNAVVRMGVEAVLRHVSGVTETIQAADGVEALDRARETRPDVVLLDVRMPRRSGIDVLPELAALAPVLMLTHSDDADMIRAALDAGARGYIVHGALTAEELAGAIRTCLAGGLVLGPQAASVMLQMARGGPRSDDAVRGLLSARECEVMDAVATGMSNLEIAEREFLAPKTVKNHLNRIYAKLGVSSRAEAVAAWAGIRRTPDQVPT